MKWQKTGGRWRSILKPSKFASDVYGHIASVPFGAVVSYGQVAVMCGKPGAARSVGQIAHFGPTHLPWHRLVKADGGLAGEFVSGGLNRHKALLQKEDVKFRGDKVIMKEHQL